MTFSQDLSIWLKIFQIVAYVAGGVVGIGAIFFGVKYGFGKAKNTNIEQNTTLLENLQAQINSQRDLIADLQQQVKKLSDQNISLLATNKSQKDTLDSYYAMLANRDPAFEQFMKDVRTFMGDWHTYVAGQSNHPIINVNSQPT